MKWVDETVPDSMRAWSWASRTFLVFGESAETRPFLRRRPTRPHTPSGNVECPVDWTHPVLYVTGLDMSVVSSGPLTGPDQGRPRPAGRGLMAVFITPEPRGSRHSDYTMTTRV